MRNAGFETTDDIRQSLKLMGDKMKPRTQKEIMQAEIGADYSVENAIYCDCLFREDFKELQYRLWEESIHTSSSVQLA